MIRDINFDIAHLLQAFHAIDVLLRELYALEVLPHPTEHESLRGNAIVIHREECRGDAFCVTRCLDKTHLCATKIHRAIVRYRKMARRLGKFTESGNSLCQCPVLLSH